jgi:NlpC/P60 family putative phage cell wall peptidase
MIPTSQVVSQAQTWLGTPWHHQARLKGVGVDCIGLLVGVCKELNISVQDYQEYARFPDGYHLAKELDRQLIKKFTQPMPGDIMLFRISRMPQHIAICSPLGLIHAHQGVMQVVETAMPKYWDTHILGVYQLPGVQPCN